MEDEVNSLFREAAKATGARPSGFIFHVSRCGSTLISNGLKALSGAQVACEARPINKLFMPYPSTGDPDADECWDRDRRILAECLFVLFSSYRTGGPEPLIVKFDSQNAICLPIVRRYWPDIPCVFVIRDPVEVIVSNLKQPAPDGKLCRFRELPVWAYAMSGVRADTPLDSISVEDFHARVLGRYLDAAAGQAGSDLRIIDYQDINQASVRDIAGLFGLSCNEDRARLVSEFGKYSKDPSGDKRFSDDRAAKQECASVATKQAASRWAMPRYAELLSLSSWR